MCSGDHTQGGDAQSLQPSPLHSCIQYFFLGYVLYMLKQEAESLQLLFTLLSVALCPFFFTHALNAASTLVCLSCKIGCVVL